MSRKLELVREEKLFRLLPGRKESSRLEASGIALVDDTTALVVFDNLNQVARINLSLKRRASNRLLPAPSLNLRAPGAAEALRCLSSGYEGGVSIFRRHRDGRLDVRQTAARSSSQYRRGRGLLISELTNGQPIMVAKGQVPPDELAAYALEEFGNGVLTIFRLSEHALDSV
jgi:hypothetical protein